MFSTLYQRLLLAIYIFILLSIPVGAYVASQNQTPKSDTKDTKETKKIVKATPKPTTPPAKDLLKSSELGARIDSLTSPSPSPSPSSTETTLANTYGPTLSLKAVLEGRPSQNHTTKLFVGIVEGILSTNPKFLLSFSVNLPSSGEYGNLSLAGLNSGSRYTALLKGSAQIATSSAFTMSPTVTNLNGGEPLTLLTGDLNEDNVINSSDYSIVQKALGATSSSVKWNENADFNKDGLINTFDLGIVKKNMGKVGASGAWTSPLPQNATPSASLDTPAVGSPDNNEGYWLWVPK